MTTQVESHGCPECGFGLWIPIAPLSSSSIGLYNDSRFPGRCIVTMDEHFEQLDAVTPDSLFGFLMDIRNSVTAIKQVTGAKRVNVAVLGNQESHVHAHLIPRAPEHEPRPDKAPWEDTRDKGKISLGEQTRLVEAIRDALGHLRGSNKYPTPRAGRAREPLAPAPSDELELFAMLSEQFED